MSDVSTFLDQLVSWAAYREDVHAVGLAGSWARGTATRESDVDLVLIVESVDELLNDDGGCRGSARSRRPRRRIGASSSPGVFTTPMDEKSSSV